MSRSPMLRHDGVRNLVFDLDGTLYVCAELGTAISRCADRYVAQEKGIDAVAAHRLIAEVRRELSTSTGGESTLSQACLALGGDLRELHRRFAEEIDPFPLLKPDSRVTGLLARLAGRYRLHIYTNNNADLAGRIMAAIGVADHFRHVFTVEDSWRPKPDRTTLELILAKIGAAPDECLFVGDRYDVDLALPAAMGCAVFLTTTIEELLRLNLILDEENP